MNLEYLESWEEESPAREEKFSRPRRRSFASDDSPRGRKPRQSFREQRRKLRDQNLFGPIE